MGCILGTLLSGEEVKAEREFEELHVRAGTGLGAEVPIDGAGLRGRARPGPAEGEREREPVASG